AVAVDERRGAVQGTGGGRNARSTRRRAAWSAQSLASAADRGSSGLALWFRFLIETGRWRARPIHQSGQNVSNSRIQPVIRITGMKGCNRFQRKVVQIWPNFEDSDPQAEQDTGVFRGHRPPRRLRTTPSPPRQRVTRTTGVPLTFPCTSGSRVGIRRTVCSRSEAVSGRFEKWPTEFSPAPRWTRTPKSAPGAACGTSLRSARVPG